MNTPEARPNPPPPARRLLLYAVLTALYLLHTDLWLWNDPSWSFGLPVGLTYHVFYCLAAAAMMAILVRHAWPRTQSMEDLTARESVGTPAADLPPGPPGGVADDGDRQG